MGQIASASSTAVGALSPLVSSSFTQMFSVERNKLLSKGKLFKNRAFDLFVHTYYKNSKFDKISVCSLLPNKCGATDRRFLYRSFTDGPTMTLNIGQYQLQEAGALNATLKVVATTNHSVNTMAPKF